MMDLGILVIVATVFVIACVILGFIFKFSMREKSYEEALAEQRQSAHSLLGIKDKPKEKKNKKLSKKTKDAELVKKKDLVDSEIKVDSKTLESSSENSIQNPNVETKKSPPQKLISKDENLGSCDIISPAQGLNLDSIPVQSNVSYKQKIKTNKKDQSKTETIKEKNSNATKKEVIVQELDHDKHNAVFIEETQVLKSDDNVKKVLKRDVLKKGVDESKKDKKEELITKDVQIKTSKTSINIPNQSNEKGIPDKTLTASQAPLNGFIVNSSKEKKKKNESNVHHSGVLHGDQSVKVLLKTINNAELSDDDIQFLINLLLNKQLDAPKGLDEWSEGKFDPVQKLKKQLAEKEKALIDEQETLASVQIKLKEVRSEQLSERTLLNQKLQILEEQFQNQQMDLLACNNRCHAQGQQLQQTQAQLNEERMKVHSLREELNAVQIQRQQLEMHITQESEVIITQLRADIQEYSARNEQMLMDINTIQKDAAENEASYIAQLSNMAQELGEKSRQLEELHIELANKNEMLYRQEGELKTEIAQLNAVMQQQAEEIRKTEQSNAEYLEELNNLKKQRSISNKVIAQLKSEIEKLQEFKIQQEAAIENNKISETEILNWKNEVTFVKNLSEERENKLQSEIDTKVNLISQLESELEEQKTKNNDLRNKNYKIMEALNAAEVRIKTIQEESSNKEKTTLKESKIDIDFQKKFLSRLLPEVNGLEEISSNEWEEECSKLVSYYLEGIKKSASNKSTENLQAKIEHYQNVIKSTEDMLTKLQIHIDQEQISWKAQLKSKDLELEALKEKLEKAQNIETINGSSEGQ